MRITDLERNYIKAYWNTKSKNRSAYLFGSRTADEKKGGDIDVLILSDEPVTIDEKMDFLIGFYRQFGQQKLDLVDFTHDSTSPFKKIALSTAVEL